MIRYWLGVSCVVLYTPIFSPAPAGAAGCFHKAQPLLTTLASTVARRILVELGIAISKQSRNVVIKVSSGNGVAAQPPDHRLEPAVSGHATSEKSWRSPPIPRSHTQRSPDPCPRSLDRGWRAARHDGVRRLLAPHRQG